jgi:hypothetical protein
MYFVDEPTYRWVLRDCDYSVEFLNSRSKILDPKGFWRVGKSLPAEQRLTVLSLIAYDDLSRHIKNTGSQAEGLEAFLLQSDGQGWQLPETLRLADYGLGHDDRAKEHQPVRECFGPQFYDWQLKQAPEESWRECHLHARNLLGPAAYKALLDELEGKPADMHSTAVTAAAPQNDVAEDFALTSDPPGRKRSRKN